ncbi:conserved unknown protein [Ectocarpus siliculosus]|uniref:B box-type domain-containing protein n=1 Tax=Ectocarpus siliculosus TaxID=2880 RepID=D7G209_ECTSI|nr:conserved unknown protein [Ectocarpus siliculosus]|eukprot:CBJ48735.1 conserved unknown protein [Ectocarpus siliculosus]
MNLLASSGEDPMPDGDSTAMEEEEEGAGSREVETCIECEDQHAELVCLSCEEPFCRPCWGSLHRQGKRAEHVTRAILGEVMPAPTAPTSSTEPPTPPLPETVGHDDDVDGGSEQSDSEGSACDGDGDRDDGHGGGDAIEGGLGQAGGGGGGHKKKGRTPCAARGEPVGQARRGDARVECAGGVPVHPAEAGRERARPPGDAERGAERLGVHRTEDCWTRPAPREPTPSVGDVSVDVYSGRWSSKARTINEELRMTLAALSGMMVAGELNWGQKNAALLDSLDDNQDAFAEIFEVGRRYKITNPEKFRDFYGKMMYMLQDAQAQGRVGLELVKDIQMVYDLVEDRGGLEMLQDERVVAATADISGISMSKAEVSFQVAAKNKARAGLLKDYVSDSFPKEEVERVLDSIADANNYIAFNVAPVERTISLLQDNFHPDKPEGEWSLKLSASGGRKRFSSSSSMYSSYGSSFSSGYGGGYGISSMFGSSSSAQLSHDHRTQYTFVWQSLLLWSEAMRSMYRLWYFADSDLLSGKASYRLQNTGQGLNRVQQCPSVSQEMRRILRVVQSTCGPWVGLSVVHLGDRDVPNALVFIDKYTQIPRILNPVAEAVRSLEEMAHDPVLGHYVDVGWGGVQNAKMAILSDFFKHGWDGSGDDGGSCIDGRLTSAWNWCSLLPKKPFAPIFYLAGQYGFDGGWSSGLGE